MTIITNDKYLKESIHEFLRILISSEKMNNTDLNDLNKLLNYKPVKGLNVIMTNKSNSKMIELMLTDISNEMFKDFKTKIVKYSDKFK